MAQEHTTLAHLWLYEHSIVESNKLFECLVGVPPMFNTGVAASTQKGQATAVLCKEAHQSVVDKIASATSGFLPKEKSTELAERFTNAIADCSRGQPSIEAAPLCLAILKRQS